MRLERLTKRVAGLAHNAPDFLVEDMLGEAARDFCRSSGVWREELDPVELEAGEALYDLEAPFGAEVSLVVRAHIGSRPVRQSQADELVVANQSGARGSPTHLAIEGGQQCRVHPIPEEAGELRLYAALVPTRAELPDWLVNRYQDALVYGAVSRLMEQPGNAWSSVEGSQFYRHKFDGDVARAKRDAMTSFGAEQRVRPQPFGG